VKVWNLDDRIGSWILFDLLHKCTPVLVDLTEFVTFYRHLFHDILRGEDGFEIHPDSLYFKPHFNVVLSALKLILPFDD
jgi:hypothetical protein